MKGLKRYWFRFASGGQPESLGCGVTARDRDDAMEILRERVFHGAGVPEVVEERDDVVLANLSAFTLRHVLPNMGNPGKHGVWFPLGETQMEPWWRLPKNGPDALGPEDRKQLEELDRKNQKQPNDMPQDMPRKLGNPGR